MLRDNAEILDARERLECRHSNLLLRSYHVYGAAVPIILVRNSATGKVVDYEEANALVCSDCRMEEVFECADCGALFDWNGLEDTDG